MSTPFNQIVNPAQAQTTTQTTAPAQTQGLPNGVSGPPKSAEDRAQRVNGWTKFLDQLKNDPVIQQFMVQAGSTMLQGKRPGENFQGMFGRALQGGNLAGQFIQQNQLQAGQNQQKIDLEAERNAISGATAEDNILTGAENRAASKQTREQGAEAFPSIQAKREAETKGTIADTKVKEEEALHIKDKTLAEIAKTRAEANAAQALANLRKGTTPTLTDLQLTRKAFNEANPGMKLKDVAQKFLDHLKLKTLTARLTVAGKMVTDLTLEPEEKEIYKKYIDDNLVVKEPAPTSSGANQQDQINPKGGPAPTTTKEYNALKSGTEYWNPSTKSYKTKP